MPHDRDGKVLAAGDTVTIRARVVDVSSGEDMCNARVELEKVDDGSVDQTFWVNTRQTQKVEE